MAYFDFLHCPYFFIFCPRCALGINSEPVDYCATPAVLVTVLSPHASPACPGQGADSGSLRRHWPSSCCHIINLLLLFVGDARKEPRDARTLDGPLRSRIPAPRNHCSRPAPNSAWTPGSPGPRPGVRGRTPTPTQDPNSPPLGGRSARAALALPAACTLCALPGVSLSSS